MGKAKRSNYELMSQEHLLRYTLKWFV